MLTAAQSTTGGVAIATAPVVVGARPSAYVPATRWSAVVTSTYGLPDLIAAGRGPPGNRSTA